MYPNQTDISDVVQLIAAYMNNGCRTEDVSQRIEKIDKLSSYPFDTHRYRAVTVI